MYSEVRSHLILHHSILYYSDKNYQGTMKMKLPEVSSYYCCSNLKTACIVIGVFGLVRNGTYLNIKLIIFV